MAEQCILSLPEKRLSLDHNLFTTCSNSLFTEDFDQGHCTRENEIKRQFWCPLKNYAYLQQRMIIELTPKQDKNPSKPLLCLEDFCTFFCISYFVLQNSLKEFSTARLSLFRMKVRYLELL